MYCFFWFTFFVQGSQFEVRILILRISLNTFLIPCLSILDVSLALEGISKVKTGLRMVFIELMSSHAPLYRFIVLILSVEGYRQPAGQGIVVWINLVSILEPHYCRVQQLALQVCHSNSVVDTSVFRVILIELRERLESTLGLIVDYCQNEGCIYIFGVDFQSKLGPFLCVRVVIQFKTVNIGNTLVCLIKAGVEVYASPITLL